MKKQNVQTLKGFRDFLPKEARARQYVAEKIKQTFENFAFEPLQTPTLEYASLLLGKYGDEADKLVYTFEDRGGREVGLRYDQTVPTARVLVQYQEQLPKAFRRYQIQNVFRADKPQKGRFREFTQCDCDIFSASPLADAEILAVYYAVFKNLGLDSIQIEYNDRELLVKNLMEFATANVSVYSIIQSIDKLDKMTYEAVRDELISKGLNLSMAEAALAKIEKIEKSDNLLEIEQKAIKLGVAKENLVFNPKIARGLDYYTGLIFEGKVMSYGQSSVGAGGRYDNLIEELAGVKMPAVGFALGFDRIVEVCQELGLIPEEQGSARVLIANFPDPNSQEKSLELGQKLREAGIAVEFYLEADKLVKQFKLAEQKAIPYIAMIGDEELKNQTISLRDISQRSQVELKFSELIKKLS